MPGRSVCSWSGGKDSCFALIRSLKEGIEPCVLLNVLNEEGKISRSHGIPVEILIEQSHLANIPIHPIRSSWKEYEQKFTEALFYLKEKYNLTHAVFGDIDLQAHRDWEEKVCSNAVLQAFLPLWKEDRRKLVFEMIDSGIKTMIISCNEKMGEKFIGKILNKEVIEELEKIDIDPCGENGEFHTLVLNCSLFKKELSIKITGKINHDNFWFAKMQLDQAG